MKNTLKTFVALLGLLALASAVIAAPYSQPYTASFGIGQTGQAANVVYYVFDAAGVLRVGPASYVNAAGATVTGPNNEPVASEIKDYTGTGGTGSYYAALPLDTAWSILPDGTKGGLQIKVVITGQAGVVASGSLLNRGSDVADGYTAALAGTTIPGINTQTNANGTAIAGLPASIAAAVNASVVTNGLTTKQIAAVNYVYNFGVYTRTKTSTTQTLTWAASGTLPGIVSVSSIDSSGNVTGRTSVTFSNLP